MNYKYNFSYVDPSTVVQRDTYSTADDHLIEDFDVNSSYNQDKDFIELHYYTLDGRLLQSVPDYTNITSAQDSETAIDGKLSTVTLGTEDDLIKGGYTSGDVYLYYNFLTDPYTETKSTVEYFIEEISPDRLELRLLTTKISDEEVVEYTNKLREQLNESDVEDFYLNFQNNRLLLATNIDTLEYEEGQSVVIRLYRELPEDISVKDVLNVSVPVANSAAYLSTAEIIQEEVKLVYLKGANFNIESGQNTSSPSGYLNINDIFSYPVTNSYYEVRSLVEEKGAQISIDYTDYNNFINFSSAEERLRNFKYKFDLISSYQSSSNAISSINNYSTSSVEYYDGLINNILGNFDHYDRFLYYETGSYSWPKSGTAKPYTLLTGSATGSWYTGQIESASNFDASNPNQLFNTIPEFLREDPDNQNYATFVHMVGQHFDNLWIYSKAVTDKYNADNRLNYGVSKDLIEDALKNFGVKLYNSTRSTQELFSMFTGETYNTGSESFVTDLISASNSIVSEEDYRRQVYKRLYHNLPFLLKSKGTERGVRALLSSFGVPSLYSSGSNLNTGSLFVTQLGGTASGSYNLGDYQYLTSSIDKIRLDNTGSNTGDTISQFVSINDRDGKYANDINLVEIGFSPANYINTIIIESASAQNFDIDTILGDPGYAYSSSYSSLTSTAEEYLLPIAGEKYDLKDFTRLLKFYDNVLFKTIKDFIPARSNIATGVIIKPHLLERSKAKQVKPTFERHNNYSASIQVGTYSGSSGDSFGSRDTFTTSYTASLMTSGGFAPSIAYLHEEPKYNGEFSGSYIRLTIGELNDENTYKYVSAINTIVDYGFVSSSAVDITPTPTPTITPSSTPAATPSPTPTVTPTVTPSPSAAVSTFSLPISASSQTMNPEGASTVTYTITYKESTAVLGKTLSINSTEEPITKIGQINLIETGDNINVTIVRSTPDSTTADDGDISVVVSGVTTGVTITPPTGKSGTPYNTTSGDSINGGVAWTWVVNNVKDGTEIDVTVNEG